MNKINKEKFLKLVSDEETDTLKYIENRIKNREDIRKSTELKWSIIDLVDNFPTKYKEGFTSDEVHNLIWSTGMMSVLAESLFYCEMRGQTNVIVEGNALSYHSDVKRALLICLDLIKTNDFD